MESSISFDESSIPYFLKCVSYLIYYILASIKSSEKKELIDYVEQLWSAAFAEQQEAYLQGLLDAFQILFGLGMLSPNENVKSIIEKIKNDSSK